MFLAVTNPNSTLLDSALVLTEEEWWKNMAKNMDCNHPKWIGLQWYNTRINHQPTVVQQTLAQKETSGSERLLSGIYLASGDAFYWSKDGMTACWIVIPFWVKPPTSNQSPPNPMQSRDVRSR